VQSVIDVTYPIELLPGTQDAIVAGVLNNVLGGSGFQTRLMQNLREDKAYTYGAYSDISADEIIGSFSAGASVRNEVTDSAIVQFIYEMDRLVKEPIADSTLQLIKNIMTGSFARSLERPQTVANFALNIERYKLPKDYYETYLLKLNAVTAADVQAMAKRVIRPNNAYITVVGNRDVMDKLKVFSADGKVEVLDVEGNPFVEMSAAPAGLTAQDVLLKHINAIGGEKALAQITSWEHTGVMEVMGMQANYSEQGESVGRLRNDITMPGMALHKSIYNQGKSVVVDMGVPPRQQDEDEVLQSQMDCDLLAFLHLTKYGVSATLKGIESIKGTECYVVETKTASGSVKTCYFGVESGLLLLERETKEMEGQVMTQEISFSDYQVTNGIKLANQRTLTMGPQSFTVKITSSKYNTIIPATQFDVDAK
jgi:zinc protease